MTVTRTLHRAGNRQQLPALAGVPVDAIEADAWVIGGRVVLQHARPLGNLPLSLHRRGLYLERRRRTLDDLLASLDPRVALVLDLRSSIYDPAPDVFTALTSRAAGGSAITLACESWAIANRVRAWLPDHRTAYSVRTETQLRRYIEGRTRDAIPAVPVAIRHSLLHDGGDLEALRRFAPRVAAWTVDDVTRACALAAWGVDEIVSNRIEVLAAL